MTTATPCDSRVHIHRKPREASTLAPQWTRPSQVEDPPESIATAGVPRDRHDRPLIHVPGSAKPVAYTRCTTFVDCIEDKTALGAWGKRMVLVGAARDPRLVDQARRLNPLDRADKQTLNRLADRAADLAGGSAKRDKGTYLHKLSEHVDRGEPLPPGTAQDVTDMAAYKTATVHLDVVHVERLVVVDALKVAGTPDRICYYEGPGPAGSPFAGNLITDLKTGSVDHGSLKMAMQLAVYSRGLFYDHATQARSPLPEVSQEWGLIIHLPAGTGRCTVHWIDLTIGWGAVQVAHQIRQLRSTRNILMPFQPGGIRDTPGLASLDTHV